MLNISYKKKAFPKLKGTRFIPHRRAAISRLLNMWPAVIMAFDNTMASRKLQNEVKPIIDRTMMELDDLMENAGTPEEFLDSHLARFQIYETKPNELKSQFVKHGHMLKLPAN